MLKFVSTTAHGALGLHAHSESHVARVEPPFPVRSITGLLLTGELTDGHTITMQSTEILQIEVCKCFLARN
jgi:hypothetical protein